MLLRVMKICIDERKLFIPVVFEFIHYIHLSCLKVNENQELLPQPYKSALLMTNVTRNSNPCEFYCPQIIHKRFVRCIKGQIPPHSSGIAPRQTYSSEKRFTHAIAQRRDRVIAQRDESLTMQTTQCEGSTRKLCNQSALILSRL